MGQGQSWGTVTVSARLASETWSKAKAGAQYSFSQVSFWDMARAGQGTAQFQSNSSSYLRGPAANFVCLVYYMHGCMHEIVQNCKVEGNTKL